MKSSSGKKRSGALLRQIETAIAPIAFPIVFHPTRRHSVGVEVKVGVPQRYRPMRPTLQAVLGCPKHLVITSQRKTVELHA